MGLMGHLCKNLAYLCEY